ncbi:MAG: DUF2284 domain-containing protein [archaeon]
MIDDLKSYFEKSNLSFIKEIPFDNLYFDERAQYMCKFGCKNYNRKYSCPPESLKVKNEIQKYDRAILFATTFNYPENASYYKKRGLNYKKEYEIQRISEELDNKFSMLGVDHFVLAGGSCKRCNQCSFEDNKPCKKPNRKQTSMEAVGIDCQKTMHDAGFDFNISDSDSINRCGCILLNDESFKGLENKKEKSNQKYHRPTKKEAKNMCSKLETEYSKFFEEVCLINISDIKNSEKICNPSCKSYGKTFSCPPYSEKIDLDLWDYAIIWKWSESNYKKYRYNQALKKIHGAFYSIGYYFALSLRDCNCKECQICNYEKNDESYCENRKILAPSMQSQGIDPNQFGNGKFGVELI